MAYPIDSEINNRMDAFRGNPNALMHRYNQSREFIDLIGFQKLTKEDKKKVVSKYNFKISTINDPKYYPHVSSWINGDGINEEIQIGEQQIRKLHNLGSDHKYNGYINGKHQFLYDMGFAKDLIYYDNKGEKIEKT